MTEPGATILLTGGAGYVGAATADALLAAGYQVVVLDDLSTGHVEFIPNAASSQIGSYGDSNRVVQLIHTAQIDAVVHCGAKSVVSESAEQPELYFSVNVQASLNLLEAVRNAGINAFVFSSSAAVYGTQPSLNCPALLQCCGEH
jgi:UDP-glucose 4-epimerase